VLGHRSSTVSLIHYTWNTLTNRAAGIFVAVGTREDQWAYRIPFALQWIWPVPIFIIVTLAPESPWYLVRKGRYEEAKKVVMRLSTRATSRKADGSAGQQVNPDNTVAMMIRTNEFEKQVQSGTSYLDCLKGSDLRRTEIACMAWASQIILGSSFSNQPTYFFQQGS
jgi:SP family general alpha glucoside:H+ symporter-like MFS transporter